MDRKLTGTPPAIRLPDGAIDTQCHMYLPGFPALPGGPGNPPDPLPTPDMYLQMADWIGISRVVVTQGNAQQGDNSCLLACLAQLADRARGVAVIDRETTQTELDRLSAAGVVGARIMDLPGGAIGLEQLEEVDAKAAAQGWVLAVQFDGSDILDHEPRLAALKSNWILDHHGKFFKGVTPDSPQADALRRLIDGGRCWYKLAGCYESSLTVGPEYADIAAMTRMIAGHASDRLIWGTNWPHNLAKSIAEYPDDAALTDTVLGWLDEDTMIRTVRDTPAALFGF
ncbi:amidohydrolase family protein [Arenibacterium halophilum]|uniref:Amidohydrolase n=1 Tax=Arenibacterium halophilum TaxID=2583821 RepID=A0ABY2WXB9_9RHOB|nr:amidohydrolase family protein [Arenibacterium halophilum]TMV07487.1 amidohydrolase [Arenibacterium halophilum]